MTTRRRIYESAATVAQQKEKSAHWKQMTPSGGEIRAMPIMRGTDKTARTLSATFEKCYEKEKKKR